MLSSNRCKLNVKSDRSGAPPARPLSGLDCLATSLHTRGHGMHVRGHRIASQRGQARDMPRLAVIDTSLGNGRARIAPQETRVCMWLYARLARARSSSLGKRLASCKSDTCERCHFARARSPLQDALFKGLKASSCTMGRSWQT